MQISPARCQSADRACDSGWVLDFQNKSLCLVCSPDAGSVDTDMHVNNGI